MIQNFGYLASSDFGKRAFRIGNNLKYSQRRAIRNDVFYQSGEVQIQVRG